MNTKEVKPHSYQLNVAKHFESLYPADSREQEIRRMVQYIQEGNSSQIVSLPGVGRSNTLGLLSYNRAIREKHFPTKNLFVHFVTVNFSELHSRPLIDVTKLLFLNLIDSLREREMPEEYAVVNEIFREVLPLQDEFVLFQGLKRAVEYIAVEKKLTLIFLFDRFEEYVPMLSHDFFSNLRSLRNIAKYRFSVIFTLYKPLEDILEAELLADFYEFVAGHVVYLKLYDEPSVTFRLQYLEQLTGKKLDEKVKDHLIQLTGGHWKLTKLGAEALLAVDEKMLNRVQHDTGELEKYLLEQRTVEGALRDIVSIFTPAELQALTVILSESEVSGDSSAMLQNDNVVTYFQNLGLLHDGTITLPLLTAYLMRQKEALSTAHEQIEFDETKNVIKKGNLIISDSLTAAEFRLLAHLLHNPETVIERNELIDVVWQGAKSTAGVTDQAVDQLIFRIRRKIEENPNHPKHLITVKGRGFEFKP